MPTAALRKASLAWKLLALDRNFSDWSGNGPCKHDQVAMQAKLLKVTTPLIASFTRLKLHHFGVQGFFGLGLKYKTLQLSMHVPSNNYYRYYKNNTTTSTSTSTTTTPTATAAAAAFIVDPGATIFMCSCRWPHKATHGLVADCLFLSILSLLRTPHNEHGLGFRV